MNKNSSDILLKPAVKIEHRWPANLEDRDIIDFKDEQLYDTLNVYLKTWGGAWISSDSVVYKNGRLVGDTLPTADYRSYYRVNHLVKKALFCKKVKLNENAKFLLVTDSWSAGHFHWFCDVLPRLFCIKDNTKDFTLLLPDTPYIRKIAIESLTQLGLEFKDIVLMKEKEFYRVSHLFYISRIAPSGHMHKDLMKEIRNQLIAGKKPGKKRVYISRAKAGFRRVLNEDQVRSVLERHRFEILYGEDASFSEQASIFSSCNTLLGIHGAGLTNCMLMHPGSTVIELRRKENGSTNVGYWHLADSLDNGFYYFNGIPDSDQSLVGKGCNITIPLEDLENRILKNLENSNC